MARKATTSTEPLREDPKEKVRRLAWEISEALDEIDDYERVIIQAKSVGPWAIYTEFAV